MDRPFSGSLARRAPGPAARAGTVSAPRRRWVVLLAARLDDFKVGDPVAQTVLRQGQLVELVVTLQAGG